MLFLDAQVSADLLAAHAAVHAALEAQDARPADATPDAAPSAITRQAALYKPAAWVPHCTLAMNLDAGSLGRVFRALHPYAGLQARVTRVCLVDIETGDAEDLVRLKRPAAASGNAGCW